ncbi:MAG: glycosyltransferase family 2 protein [Planctomycetes bacterium]|nr:glycosyltransferase family 2 protein [Planctomycetota bacterium]
MKVIIQIPCWNEEASLPATYAALPRELPGVDVVETLVIDDGSDDRTVEVARELGVTHIVRLVTHQGLARGFQRGILACLERGADVIVNTDADNQYCADDIPKLVAPILAGEAEVVVGDRDVPNLAHFSWLKKKLHGVGSYVVRVASGTSVPDAPSGFRAFSRRAALQLSVHSDYTYTHETLIQAGQKNLAVVSVPIRVNPVTRASRLFKSIRRYVTRSANTIVRIYLLYNAFRVLLRLAGISLALSILALATHVSLPHLWPEVQRPGTLLLWIGGAFGFAAGQLLLGAVLADLLAVNRRLQEETLAHLRALRFGGGGALEVPGQAEEPSAPSEEPSAPSKEPDSGSDQ